MNNRFLRYFFVCCCMFVCAFNVFAESYSGKHFARDKSLLIVHLVRSRDITDNKVLTAIKKVKRHEFIPEGFKARAYKDEEMGIPIGYNQTISPIHTVAFMTQSLQLKGNEKVLEIGTGSGYQAAVLAEIVKEVYTIEIIDELAKLAEARLKALGYTNITVKAGDGFIGWKEHAPYDAILVTASVDKIPEPLIQQLAEGGRIIIPLYKTENEQEFILAKKINGKITHKKLDPPCKGPHGQGIYFVPMIGEHTGILVPNKE